MSERRDSEELEDVLDDEEEELLEDDELVEYLVDEELASWVLTSVPKSEQLSQTSNSAPSTLIVLGELVSAPHISH
jgi:hypothetical protein